MSQRKDKTTLLGGSRVIEADKKYHRIILAAFVVFIYIGALLIHWGIPLATDYLLQLEPHKSLRILQILISVIFLSVVPMAWSVYSLGQKVVKSEQMPPPGTRVIKKTRVIEGRQAVLRGKVLIVLAILLSVTSLIGGIWFPFRLEKVMADKTASDPNTTSTNSVDIERRQQ